MTQPDRYSRNPVSLQQWLHNTVGDPPRSTPADVTLQNVIDLGYRYHQLRASVVAAQDARADQYDTYSAAMSDDNEALKAYKELQYLMVQHAQDVPREYSGHVYGLRVIVTFEPVHGHVTVDVREGS
jgi:hypothetical protein